MAFTGELWFAEWLEAWLHASTLHLPWNLIASFGPDRRLWWRLFVYLEALPLHHALFPWEQGRWWRTFRAHRDRDLARLVGRVTELGQMAETRRGATDGAALPRP